MTPDVLSLSAGAEAQLSAQANDDEGRPIPGVPIVYRSRDPSYLSVDERGRVVALGPTGSASVSVTSGTLLREIPITISPGGPAALSKESGDQQTAPATRTLADGIMVSVKDALGNPIPGTRMRFRALEGSAEPAEAAANSAGIAEARWTLGPRAGEQSLLAEVDGPRGVVQTRFIARAEAGPLALLEKAPPEVSTSIVGAVVVQRVRATDDFGNPQPGISVLWGVTEGDGSVAAAVTETDADGVATAEWRVGERVGRNVVIARAAGLAGQAARFEVATKPGPAVRLVPLPDTSEGGAALRVVDAFENPVPAVLVRFQLLEGGGILEDEAAMTDDDGVARVERWEPESAPAAIQATIAGEIAPLRFERATRKD